VARRAALGIAVTLAVVAGAALPARAQALQRLTVQSFDLSADTTAPKVDVPFHLILRLRVRERVAQIYNLNLPMLAQLELLGDERETVAGTRGTQYRETISVVARAAGSLAVAPATLQAIDAHDGKAKQWYTNGLTLVVHGAPLHLPRPRARYVLWALAFAAVAVIAVLVFLRRRAVLQALPAAPAAPPPPPPAAAPPPLVRSQRQQAHDALIVLRAERSRAAAVTVRAAVWRMVGAPEGETLGDVLRRADISDVPLHNVLVALERAAFTYDADLRGAIEDACSALERYIESLP
jgi:hypothetical protein